MLQIHYGGKRFPEMGREDRSMIGDERFRDVVHANDIIEEQTCAEYVIGRLEPGPPT